jgi:hypothetical protein
MKISAERFVVRVTKKCSRARGEKGSRARGEKE